MPSFLDIVAACDSFDPAAAIAKRECFPFHVAGHHVGFVPAFVLPALDELTEGPDGEEAGFSMIYAIPDDPNASPYLEIVEFDPEDKLGFMKRTRLMDSLLRLWREKDVFACLHGWRKERYPVYGPPAVAFHEGITWDGIAKHRPTRALPKNAIMTIERSGAELFGIRTFGAHLTGFVKTPEMRIWVAQRSLTKQTFPGMLDNTVAGGIPVDQTPYEAIVRECAEEAGIPEDLARKATAVGAITYNTTSRLNGIGPEAQFIYDLELPADLVPKPEDGEVAGFELCGVEKVVQDLRNGLFKPNCAMIVIDFLMRHGIVTPENEPDYLEITSRLHNRSELHGPCYV